MAKDNKYINYLGRDFNDFRGNLIEYAKTYFPNTYNDFSEASPGMMFVEMASYIGDVLSYYTDASLNESFVQTATETSNLFKLARMFGYKPRVSTPAITTLSVYQLSKANSEGKLDERYLLKIKSGLQVSDINGNFTFVTSEDLDFSDPENREVTVSEIDAITKKPDYFLIKKKIKAISAEVKTKVVSVGTPTPFYRINLDETNIISIESVYDNNENRWYEVPYLAQEMIFEDYSNIKEFDPDLAQFRETVPYILKLKKTNKRFITTVNENRTITLQFGGGNQQASDELIIPNVKNVGLGLNNSISRLEESYDPTNFLKTKTYGEAPGNTTLTITYLVGGGVGSNIEVNKLRNISNIEFDDTFAISSKNLDSDVYSRIKSSVAVNNEVPATGGRGIESDTEIKLGILSNFSSQNRAVTSKDYQIRSLSMPAKYGNIAKIFAVSDSTLDANSSQGLLASSQGVEWLATYVKKLAETYPDISTRSIDNVKEIVRSAANLNAQTVEKINPFAINLYVLGYDSNKNLTYLNRAVKENLKTYLNEYRMLTDGINIIDGFVINIGVEFEIKVLSNVNTNQILLKCVNEIKSFFDIDKWQFNQPIYISEIELLLASVDGVVSVSNVRIVNKAGGSYSKYRYDVSAATKAKILYPSIDPSVFEIKYPNQDIKGRII